MVLSPQSILDIQWWVENLQSSYKPINHGKPTGVIKVDASLKGWGATWETLSTQGIWNKLEMIKHINCLELLAVIRGLQSCKNVHDSRIRVMSDNSTTVSYINAMGGSRSVDCDQIAKDIREWAAKRNKWLSAAHTPGVENNEADFLSRT